MTRILEEEAAATMINSHVSNIRDIPRSFRILDVPSDAFTRLETFPSIASSSSDELTTAVRARTTKAGKTERPTN
jgi:hypothetical protein